MPGLWVRASPGARYFERRTPKNFLIRPWQDSIVFSFYEMPQIALNIMTVSSCRHRWFSGRMLACHAGGPGSIPGRCIFFLFFFASKQMQQEFQYDLLLFPPIQRKKGIFCEAIYLVLAPLQFQYRGLTSFLLLTCPLYSWPMAGQGGCRWCGDLCCVLIGQNRVTWYDCSSSQYMQDNKVFFFLTRRLPTVNGVFIFWGR